MSTPAPQVTIAGRLEIERHGRDCAWVTIDNGERVSLNLPDGWQIEFDPPADLIDATGRVRAIQGDRLLVKGSFTVGETVCGGRVFTTTDISFAP